ncbi:MAG: FAD-dependent oxidoreductase [Gemmatimonadetes bacterium]|jgi:monoamine oxidase|nr:FAD-dependent oxidoreductase [Gemmatimonadota bacterium]|tara:strand:- start:4761 stop:6290 length:1530 start_codon:yes stop_codon:yes gene_type:complete
MDANKMTRRQLLQRFGAVGGSSLVMGAMGAWDLMGQPSGPRPVMKGPRPDTKVIVLGAGLSGLTVGYELGKLDYDYRVLEARDSVGGLCWTVRRGMQHTEIGGETQVCDFDEGQYINAGAWRIPNRDQGIIGYCKELGVPLQLFVNLSDANYYYEEDPELGSLSGQRVRLREVKADMWGSITELLAKAMDSGQIDAPLSEEDEVLLMEFLVRAGYLDSEDHFYGPPELRGSEDRWDFGSLLRSNFGGRVRSLYAGTGGPDPVFQPIGGMNQIPLAFERAMGHHITFGAEVRSIRQSEQGVRVVYRDTRTGREREETADFCVSCLPMSILKKIDVNFSPEMAEAVGKTEHSSSAKMGLQMKRRFWEEDDGIFGGHLWSSSLQLGEFSYPSNDFYSDKGVLLGYYGRGGQAGLADMRIRDRVEHTLTQASKVHPQMREEFEHAYCVWWDKVPFSEGAYGRTPDAELLGQLSKPDGRVYLGSAGASGRPAWLEGAIQSAWRTVEALHERVSA